MHKLYKSYHPVTATPYQCTEDYMEFAPCEALKPYIRCFWGSRRAATRAENGAGEMDIVIPDTCMDIIFHVDFTHNHISSSFFGIDDRTFAVPYDGEKNIFFVFAVRFYPWGAALFAEESLRETKNAFLMRTAIFPQSKGRWSGICLMFPISASSFLLRRKYC